MHQHGEHRLECAGDRSGALARGRPQDSHWDRVVCGSDSVPKTVADDNPMLHTPGKAKSCRPASGKLQPDLGARETSSKMGLPGT